MSLHYTFPPAAGYPLNRCLYRPKSDDAFRERYLKDPDGTLRDASLDAGRIAALRALDRDRLLALGATPTSYGVRSHIPTSPATSVAQATICRVQMSDCET